MRQSATRHLHAYWSGLCGQRATPERADVDPAAIRSILPETFMLEVDAAASYPVLLAGTRCNALFGKSLRGLGFVDLFAAGDRIQIAGICAAVCDGAVPIVAGLRGGPRHVALVDLELLLLPLRHHGKTHSRILGIVAPASSPAWLGLVPMPELNLVSMRIVTGDAKVRRPLASGSESQTRAGDQPAREARRAHLSLIQGGRSG